MRLDDRVGPLAVLNAIFFLLWHTPLAFAVAVQPQPVAKPAVDSKPVHLGERENPDGSRSKDFPTEREIYLLDIDRLYDELDVRKKIADWEKAHRSAYLNDPANISIHDYFFRTILGHDKVHCSIASHGCSNLPSTEEIIRVFKEKRHTDIDALSFVLYMHVLHAYYRLPGIFIDAINKAQPAVKKQCDKIAHTFVHQAEKDPSESLCKILLQLNFIAIFVPPFPAIITFLPLPIASGPLALLIDRQLFPLYAAKAQPGLAKFAGKWNQVTGYIELAVAAVTGVYAVVEAIPAIVATLGESLVESTFLSIGPAMQTTLSNLVKTCGSAVGPLFVEGISDAGAGAIVRVGSAMVPAAAANLEAGVQVPLNLATGLIPQAAAGGVAVVSEAAAELPAAVPPAAGLSSVQPINIDGALDVNRPVSNYRLPTVESVSESTSWDSFVAADTSMESFGTEIHNGHGIVKVDPLPPVAQRPGSGPPVLTPENSVVEVTSPDLTHGLGVTPGKSGLGDLSVRPVDAAPADLHGGRVSSANGGPEMYSDSEMGSDSRLISHNSLDDLDIDNWIAGYSPSDKSYLRKAVDKLLEPLKRAGKATWRFWRNIVDRIQRIFKPAPKLESGSSTSTIFDYKYERLKSGSSASSISDVDANSKGGSLSSLGSNSPLEAPDANLVPIQITEHVQPAPRKPWYKGLSSGTGRNPKKPTIPEGPKNPKVPENPKQAFEEYNPDVGGISYSENQQGIPRVDGLEDPKALDSSVGRLGQPLEISGSAPQELKKIGAVKGQLARFGIDIEVPKRPSLSEPWTVSVPEELNMQSDPVLRTFLVNKFRKAGFRAHFPAHFPSVESLPKPNGVGATGSIGSIGVSLSKRDEHDRVPKIHQQHLTKRTEDGDQRHQRIRRGAHSPPAVTFSGGGVWTKADVENFRAFGLHRKAGQGYITLNYPGKRDVTFDRHVTLLEGTLNHFGLMEGKFESIKHIGNYDYRLTATFPQFANRLDPNMCFGGTHFGDNSKHNKQVCEQITKTSFENIKAHIKDSVETSASKEYLRKNWHSGPSPTSLKVNVAFRHYPVTIHEKDRLKVTKYAVRNLKKQAFAQLITKAWGNVSCYLKCYGGHDNRGGEHCKPRCWAKKHEIDVYGFDELAKRPWSLDKKRVRKHSWEQYKALDGQQLPLGTFTLSPLDSNATQSIPTLAVCEEPRILAGANTKFPCVCGSIYGNKNKEFYASINLMNQPEKSRISKTCRATWKWRVDTYPAAVLANMCLLHFENGFMSGGLEHRSHHSNDYRDKDYGVNKAFCKELLDEVQHLERKHVSDVLINHKACQYWGRHKLDTHGNKAKFGKIHHDVKHRGCRGYGHSSTAHHEQKKGRGNHWAKCHKRSIKDPRRCPNGK